MLGFGGAELLAWRLAGSFRFSRLLTPTTVPPSGMLRVTTAAAPMVASGSVHEDANGGADNALSGVNLKLLNGCSPSGPKED